MNTIDKKGWKKVTVGEVCNNLNITTQNPIDMGIDRYVGLEHIETGNLHINSWGNVAEGTTFTKTFKRGHILFGKRRAYLKKAAVADFEGLCSGDILVLEAKEDKINHKLLPFLISSDRFFDYAVQTSAGSLSPRTKFQDLAKFEFLLPPKDQQTKLAELLWAGDEVVEKYEGIGNRLQTLKKTFISQKIIKSNFPQKSLTDVTIVIRNGITEKQSPNQSEYKVTRIETISDGTINLDKVGYVENPSKRFFDYKLLNGDVLFSHINSVAHIGKVAFFEGDSELYHGMNLIGIRPDTEMILPKYLFYILQSEISKKHFEKIAKQAVNQASLDLGDIGSYYIPYPEIRIQKSLLKRLSIIELQIIEVRYMLLQSSQIQKQLTNQIFSL